MTMNHLRAAVTAQQRWWWQQACSKIDQSHLLFSFTFKFLSILFNQSEQNGGLIVPFSFKSKHISHLTDKKFITSKMNKIKKQLHKLALKSCPSGVREVIFIKSISQERMLFLYEIVYFFTKLRRKIHQEAFLQFILLCRIQYVKEL